MTTLKELIHDLALIAEVEGDEVEVVTIDDDEEINTPVIVVGPNRDGIRRVRLC